MPQEFKTERQQVDQQNRGLQSPGGDLPDQEPIMVGAITYRRRPFTRHGRCPC